MMKNILIFSKQTFPLSATFIYRQILGASGIYRLFLVSLRSSHENNFPLPGVNQIRLQSYYGWADRFLFYLERKFLRHNAGISPAARKKFEAVIRDNNIQLIHIHYGTWAVALLDVLKKRKIPFIVSFHGYDASKALRNKSYRAALPDLCMHAARLIIVSEHMQSTLNLSQWKAKVKLIPYGVDCNVFKRSRPMEIGNEVKILHSGRLASKKGVPDLIRVYSRLQEKYPAVSLHILGDGKEMELCRDLVETLKLHASVHFYGSKPLSDVIALMNACHVFVLNSRTSDNGDMEGLPNAVLEAMSMEMAVVSTVHAGIPTAVQHEACGLLVPEKDNDALLAALSGLVENPALIVRLGSRARERIEQFFTLERMQSGINEVYHNLLD